MNADDTVIYFSGDSIPDFEMKLSLDFASVSHWPQENNLFLDIKKMECLLFGIRQQLMLSENTEALCSVLIWNSHHFLQRF